MWGSLQGSLLDKKRFIQFCYISRMPGMVLKKCLESLQVAVSFKVIFLSKVKIVSIQVLKKVSGSYRIAQCLGCSSSVVCYWIQHLNNGMAFPSGLSVLPTSDKSQ